MPAVRKGKSSEKKTPIQTIETLGPKSAEAFSEAGITTVEELLEAGATKKGRQDLHKKVASHGISEHQILQWCNRADLMRIKGIGEEWSDLLEVVGVDTVKELKHRVPENLHTKIMDHFEATKGTHKPGVVRRPPTLKHVKKFVAQAKRLKAVMEY